MSYLTNKDFTLLIQDVNLQQIINENEAIRQQAELTAIGEARSYLIQKYFKFIKSWATQQTLIFVIKIMLFVHVLNRNIFS